MKIPDSIYDSVQKSQVTEKVLSRCLISCRVWARIYAYNAVKALNETPDKKHRMNYHKRKMEEWQELGHQLLSYAKPVCVYKLTHLIENTNTYFIRYFYFYKIGGYKFTAVVDEQDLDHTLPVYDEKDQPEIKEYKLKPYPRDFCREVLKVLKEHGLYDTAKKEEEA